MDGRTHKKNKKALRQLLRAGFRSPHKIVVEDKFVAAMNRDMVGLRHIRDLFKCQPKLFITKCTYKRYKDMGRSLKNDFSKHLEILDCSHEEMKHPLDCLKSILGKLVRKHYVLGSNCAEISESIGMGRKIPVLTCRRGSLVIRADVESIPVHNGLKTEADEEELNRLRSLFQDRIDEDGS